MGTEMISGEGSLFTLVRCHSNEEWREERRKGIGGSDVAAIMGLSAYKSPFQVYVEKTEGLSDDISDKPSVYWGNVLEPVVADEYARRHPETEVIVPDFMLRSKDRPWAQASLDRVIVDPELGTGVLEIKTAGFMRSCDWDEYVPIYYLTQVAHYMSVTGCGFADVAVLIGGQDYREFRVMRDQDDIETVNRAVDRFWEDNVLARVPPSIGPSDSGTIFSMHKTDDGEMVESETVPSALSRYLRAKSRRDMADEEMRECSAELRDIIGDHKGIRCPSGTMTWRRTEVNRIDTKALAKDRPDIVEEYTSKVSRDMGLHWRPVKE